MQLLIGITPNMKDDQYNVAQIHSDIMENLDAIPFILPYIEKEKTIDSVVTKLDGLYVTGGDDIDPTFFNEEPIEGLRYIIRKRDMFEQKLIQKMLQQNKPIFAICRGVQILNIADRKSTRLNSSHVAISYAVFCLKKKRKEKV